jgi:hypothetical protein
MYRTVDALKIEQIWMNVYHGGTAVSPYDQHLYVDNVVVARQYIGPMRAQVPEEPDEADEPEGTPETPDPPGGDDGEGGRGCYLSALR